MNDYKNFCGIKVNVLSNIEIDYAVEGTSVFFLNAADI